MPFQVIPNARFGNNNATGLVPRGALEGTAGAIQSMRLTTAARRAPLPVIYGRERVGGLVTRPVVDAAGNLLIPLILGVGEIDEVESVEFDDQAVPAGVTRTDYLGTASQVADPWLVAAWAARGVTYADTLPGVAYTVLKVPSGTEYGVSRINVTVRGRKVQEPRIAPAWHVPFADAGSGVASIVKTHGSGSGTMTRAGATATTVLSNGLMSSTIAADTLRSYYDPSSLAYLGAIFEEARTNLAYGSAVLTGGLFITPSLTGTTVTANTATAPDGTTTADNVARITGAGDKRLQMNFGIANDSLSHIFSLFVKKNAADAQAARIGQFFVVGTSVNASVTFRVDTGAVTASVGTYGLSEWSSGHFRAYVKTTNNSTGNTTLAATFHPGLGSGTDNKDAWGWDIQKGGFPTTHIPTVSASSTRAKDLLAWPTSGNIATNDCTMFRDWTPLATGMGTVYLWGVYVDANNYAQLYHDGTNLVFRCQIGGNNYDATKALTIAAGTTYRLAWRWSSTAGKSVFVDGVKGTDSANTTALFTLPTNMQINADGNGVVAGAGCCKSITSFLYALTDGEVADYTTAGADVISGVQANRVWSENPALCYADFITNADFGRGEAIDWDSVATVADMCDEVIGTEPRRTLGLAIGDRRPIDQWDDTLRALAGCWKVYEGATAKLVADAPAASVYAFTRANTVMDSIRLTRRDPSNAPTVFRVSHTDRNLTPWGQGSQEYVLPGVDTGALPYVDANIELPGCPSASMALREAIRRGKASELADANIRLVTFDEAIKLQRGDVFTVTESTLGLSAKPFRCDDIRPVDLGRYEVSGVEYQPGVYTDATADDEVIPDTGLRNPNDPPAVTGLAVSEVLIQKQGGGIWVSSILATWTNPTFGFRADCVIQITQGGSVVANGATIDASQARWQSGELKEALAYLVNVYTRSGTGALSPVAQAGITLQGKGTVPGDPVTFAARELGGKLFYVVTIPTDPSIDGIEIRELPDGSSDWDDPAGTVVYTGIDLSPVIEGRPAGDWTYAVKTRDTKRTTVLPRGQYSSGMLTQDVTITLDTASLIRDQYVFTNPTVSNMTEYSLAADPSRYWVTDMGDGLGFGADNTDNAVGTFADSLQNVAFAHPHTSGTSEWLSETFDFGQALQADWNVATLVTAISGSATVTLQLKALIGDAWTDFTTLPARGEYRYARVKIQALTTATMQVTATAASPRLSIDAAARRETGSVTTSATLPTTVTLEGKYSKAKAIVITPEGTTARLAVYDNVALSLASPNTFDIYAFNDAGAQVAVPVSWIFEGI